MNNLFFYTRKELIPSKEGEEQEYKYYTDSFNINKVIRTVELENGEILVLLDDIHQRITKVPTYSNKNRQKGIKNDTSTVQSEIYLTEKTDIERFYTLA